MYISVATTLTLIQKGKRSQINSIGAYQSRNKYSPIGDGDAPQNCKLQVTPGMFFLFH